MATPEAKATQEVLNRASQWKARLFRNNTGVAYDQRGVPVRFGLGNESEKLNKELKSGDYVGFIPITITPEMVGKTIPVFANIEMKAAGFRVKNVYNRNTREYGQNNFNILVNDQNGIAGFAYDWQSFDQIMNEFYLRITSNG